MRGLVASGLVVIGLTGLAGPAGTTAPSGACGLVSTVEAASVLGTSHVNQLKGTMGRTGSLCGYVVAATSPTPSIQVRVTTSRNAVRTIETLLKARSVTSISQPGKPTLSTTRHFVTLRGVRAVYTLQGNPAEVQLASGATMPEANLGTVVKGRVIQVLVSGVAQPQIAAERTMTSALEHA